MIPFAAFLNPKALLRLAVIAAAIYLGIQVMGYINDAMDNAAKVLEQEVVIQLKDNEINTLTETIGQAREAEMAAEAAREEAERVASELRAIRDAALSAGDEFDGPIAPVLGDTLRALRNRMQ